MGEKGCESRRARHVAPFLSSPARPATRQHSASLSVHDGVRLERSGLHDGRKVHDSARPPSSGASPANPPTRLYSPPLYLTLHDRRPARHCTTPARRLHDSLPVS